MYGTVFAGLFLYMPFFNKLLIPDNGDTFRTASLMEHPFDLPDNNVGHLS
jgi:hypothetical protein